MYEFNAMFYADITLHIFDHIKHHREIILTQYNIIAIYMNFLRKLYIYISSAYYYLLKCSFIQVLHEIHISYFYIDIYIHNHLSLVVFIS